MKSAPSLQRIVAEFPDAKPTFLESISSSVLDAPSLLSASIPTRETIVKPFLKQGDLGFIFGPRGLGKTWISLGLAKLISEGGNLGAWDSSSGRKVLVIDGEMNLDASQERLRLLKANSDNLEFLHHEALYMKTDGEASLNLAEKEQQNDIAELVKQRGTQVVILDNLSCLFRGVSENEADAWEAVLPWLLDFRRAGVTVIIVAHAGRNGSTMRGTSKREDAAHWILSLAETTDDDGDFSGARFKTRFTKQRNATPDQTPPLVWEFESTERGMRISSEAMSDLDAMVELIENGIDSATDIGKELDRSKGTISKWAKKLSRQDRISIESGKYFPVVTARKTK